MRRKDREIESPEEKLRILDGCTVCRLAMADNNEPYIVPLNFGYTYKDEVLTLYFHSAREGKKIDIMKKNARVCFEMDGGHSLVEADTACGYGYAYESVTGSGSVVFIEDPAEKAFGLNMLMKRQTGKGDFAFPESALAGLAVYKVVASSFTGKKRPAPESAVPLTR
ncbi:MAG: pyridoxamine 5'-phosphate oxidase family protein [Spirochaetales bacterium]|nr:pyridoxamine 5'-phosphate oxidase family protein [Spirochaetales bacterium]